MRNTNKNILAYNRRRRQSNKDSLIGYSVLDFEYIYRGSTRFGTNDADELWKVYFDREKLPMFSLRCYYKVTLRYPV